VKRKKVPLKHNPNQSSLSPKPKLKKNRKEKMKARKKKVQKANLKSLFLQGH
jgi:hypothetical protein